MSNITFIFPVIALVAVVFFSLNARKRTAGYDQQYSNYRAAELAQRMGLQLVQGDPTFNLFISQANAEVRRGASDDKPLHIEIRMQGQPYGVPLEFLYLSRVEQDTGFSTVTMRTWFECKLTAHARQQFPVFEVLSRKTPVGPIPQTQSLAAIPTGNPQVDAEYVVATQEPGMANLLGQVLPAFSGFQTSGVHLLGDGRSISFMMKKDGAPLLANALYFAEVMAKELSELGRRVGG
ncbi:MAG: hypothetical protein QM756_08790 [Polyangiaceae bacterium]